MQETIKIGSNQITRIENERIGAFILDITALQVDGITVADIADLNKISLEIAVYRKGSKTPEYIVNDYLDYVMRALFGGNLGYTVATTKRTKGYLIPIDLHGSLNLMHGDYCEVKVYVQNSAFIAMVDANSYVTLETVPAPKNAPVLSVVESINYIAGDDKIDKSLGNHIEKIVMVNDLTADYDASAKAKPTNGIVLTADGLDKTASENLLKMENYMRLQNNPETNVMNLVLYGDPRTLLNNVKLKAKLDKAVDTDAKIMVLRRKAI